jgi:hypothetical protein
MAKGWRLHREYGREEFAETLRSCLSLLSEGSSWLAKRTQIHKPTISQVLKAQRSCTVADREKIVAFLAEHLYRVDGHGQIERLINSAGLDTHIEAELASIRSRNHARARNATLAFEKGRPPIPTGTKRGSTPPEEDLPNILASVEEGLRVHHQLHRVLEAHAIFQRVADQAVAMGRVAVALRAKLNSAYTQEEVGEIESAEIDACDVVCLAKSNRLWNIAAEAEQLRGRISLRREDYDLARERFDQSNGFLRQLGGHPQDVNARWPANLPRVGHSFIVAHDAEVPSAVLRAGNSHFLAKTDLLRIQHDAMPYGVPASTLLGCADQLRRAYELDCRSNAGHHIGFDLMLRSRAACEMAQCKDAERLLSESRDYFDRGAVGRNWYTLRAHLTASDDGRFALAWYDVERASDLLTAWSPSAIAEIYDQGRALYQYYQPKYWQERAFRFALAARVLQPFPSFERRFKEAARMLREEERAPGQFHRKVRSVVEQFWEFRQEFAAVGDLLGRLGAACEERLKNNMWEALSGTRCLEATRQGRVY